MEIIIARESGFCYGVKRALRLARETRQQEKSTVYTWGELIHNPAVIQELAKEGIIPTEEIDQIKGSTVVIRSHGVSPEILQSLSRTARKVIDATCPIVKKIQQLTARLARQKLEIIIVGNPNHPEIKALWGTSGGRAIIVEKVDQALTLPPARRRVVLAQSTQDQELFAQVVAVLVSKSQELRVYNTICRSTQIRQQSTSELASKVDALFIIGGTSSSNTNKLYEISKRIQPRTYFIEKADQIRPEMLFGAEKIGISGGASTPPKAIQEAVIKIKVFFQKSGQEELAIRCPR
ncbi:MAG: 4-hydroxy-3-methylbut-2-enyl diphosphate reductase [Candidatus Aminicenantes bacterium]|nr:4-hydroxy-3-methylbut-2-enyl diphosphate reductase [Candidatus Aminicenantes bacterium]